MEKKKVLLVDNDQEEKRKIQQIAGQLGHELHTSEDGAAAYEKVLANSYDLIITDLELPGMSGLDLLKKTAGIKADIPLVVISRNAGVEQAVKSMKLGASDFLSRPLSSEMIRILLKGSSNGGPSNKKMQDAGGSINIVTNNAVMNRLLEDARDVADSRASIFIEGASGTGKELLAKYIHHAGRRRTKPFVAINCSALPETLLENELFGHEKGAFTGAVKRKAGKFELADQGTILLDEISEMNMHLQSKLLRVLQEREIDRIGGSRPVPVDVRVIATTNRDIRAQIESSQFREDLYYRLNVIPFHLPPLRARRDDIPLLIECFIAKYNRIDNRSIKGMQDDAVQAAVQMPWKGNVRELENVIERAVLMCKKKFIAKEDLMPLNRERFQEQSADNFISPVPLKEMEKKVIFSTLDRTAGNRTRAAEMLGISVRTLRNKLNEYMQKIEAR